MVRAVAERERDHGADALEPYERVVRYEFKEQFTRDLTANVDKVWQPQELIAYILGTKPRSPPGGAGITRIRTHCARHDHRAGDEKRYYISSSRGFSNVETQGYRPVRRRVIRRLVQVTRRRESLRARRDDCERKFAVNPH